VLPDLPLPQTLSLSLIAPSLDLLQEVPELSLSLSLSLPLFFLLLRPFEVQIVDSVS